MTHNYSLVISKILPLHPFSMQINRLIGHSIILLELQSYDDKFGVILGSTWWMQDQVNIFIILHSCPSLKLLNAPQMSQLVYSCFFNKQLPASTTLNTMRAVCPHHKALKLRGALIICRSLRAIPVSHTVFTLAFNTEQRSRLELK